MPCSSIGRHFEARRWRPHRLPDICTLRPAFKFLASPSIVRSGFVSDTVDATREHIPRVVASARMPHHYTENLLMSLYTIPSPARGSRGRDYADLLAKSPSRRRLGAAAPFVRAGLLAVSLTCAIAQAQDSESKSEEAVAVRNYISEQVGGLHNLQVPARNEDLPTPKQSDGSVAYRFETTEAKRFLGKLLFHDPVRTARIDINQDVPVDLPAGTAFGGTVSASDPNIQKIIAATKQTGSCGSCHIGEAAGKAGQVINFNVGG